MLDVSQQTSALPQTAVTSKDAVRPARAGQLARPKPTTSRRAKAATVTEAPVAPLRTPAKRDRPAANDIFVCDEESHFYSQCLERFLVRYQPGQQTVVEFGSGDGTPVVRCLSKAHFDGVIHGFELNPKAATLAQQHASRLHLSHKYQVHNTDFYEGIQQLQADCLIANPPYIPAPDNDILMPALHGGVDGANLTRDLMSLGFNSAVLLISSYANPVKTLQHAREEGYHVTDYMVTPLPFGYYSSEPKVRSWLAKMKAEGQAFYAESSYLLAGVLLQKQQPVSQQRLDAHNGVPQAAPTLQNNIVTWGSKTVGNATTPDAQKTLDQADELLRILTCL